MRWLSASLLILLLLGGTGKAQPVAEPLIEYNPHGQLTDMMNLFTDDSPWPEAQKKVKVLILVHYWIWMTPIDQVRQVVEFAKKHNMKISLSVEPVRRYPADNCGGSEGYSDPGELTTTVNVLKSLGADVYSVEMDEPLWFGSYDTGSTDCQFSVAEMTNRVALQMAEVLAVYPNAIITEIEPIPSVTSVATWEQDMASFERGLEKALGSPVRMVQLDIYWANPWQSGLQAVHEYTRSHNMQLGIIYDGSPLATSDQTWIATAIANMEAVEGQVHIVPEMASFQSWNPWPVCSLPETNPNTMTWWINRYPRPRTILQAQFQGLGAFGKLTTENNQPIANATIKGFMPGIDFSKPLPTSVLTGVVPAGAASVIIGVRLNMECSGCNGLNDVLFGPLQYQEIKAGSGQGVYPGPAASDAMNGTIVSTEVVGGARVTRVIAFPGQAQYFNSAAIPVTVNATYVVAAPASTVAGRGWFGNIVLIFVDANGGAVLRVWIQPDPGKTLTSTTVTAADGTFNLPKIPRNVDGPGPVTIEFDGQNGTWRSSVWTPLQ